jgi:hypothetical protein
MAVFAEYGWLDLGLSISFPRFFPRHPRDLGLSRLQIAQHILCGVACPWFFSMSLGGIAITVLMVTQPINERQF